jgi:hypothetical protein
MLVGVDLDQAGVNGKAFVSIGRTIVLLVHMCASAETNPAAGPARRPGAAPGPGAKGSPATAGPRQKRRDHRLSSSRG